MGFRVCKPRFPTTPHHSLRLPRLPQGSLRTYPRYEAPFLKDPVRGQFIFTAPTLRVMATNLSCGVSGLGVWGFRGFKGLGV